MSETLHIKNFGPIKDVKLELKKINVFIGDQGTGKSTVGKVYSILKNFIYLIIFNHDNPEKQENNTWQFEEYLKTFEISGYLTNVTEISYKDDGFNDIEILYKNKIIVTNLKREFIVPPNFNYIVAERVFVSTLSDAFFGLNQFGTKLPTLFNRFGNKFSTARKEKSRRDYGEILNVTFSHINGVDSVILEDNSIVPLSDTSTGLQGTIPLLVVYDNIVELINSNSNSSKIRDHLLVIEEPELNLFPLTQKKLLNYIIGNNFEVRGNIDEKTYKNQLLITTHSPYILTALNNLIYAHEIGKLNKESVENLIDFKYWVNPDDVSVYQLLTNGTCESIMDEELKQIKVEKIDEISEILSKQWHELADLNFAK